MNAEFRTNDYLLKFLGSKPDKLFTKHCELTKVAEEMYKGLTKTKENEKDN